MGYLFASIACRDSSQGPIGLDMVVVVQPVTQSLLHPCWGEEENHREAILSGLAIEALNVADFNRLSGSYEIDFTSCRWLQVSSSLDVTSLPLSTVIFSGLCPLFLSCSSRPAT